MLTLIAIFMESVHARRIAVALLLLVAIHAIGTVGYLLVAPATSVVDAFYMTFITVATIGYAEVVDLTGHPWGRLFTVAISFAGIGTMTFIFSNVTAFMLETNLNEMYRRRRMQSRLDALSGHYIVCGAGRAGGYVLQELRNAGAAFVVIEQDPAVLAHHAERDARLHFIEGDAADDDRLRAAGVERARGVFAVTGDDSRNLVISLSTKQINPAARVIARVHDPRNAAKTLRAGADEIVSPDYTGGHRIASLMLRPHMVSLFDQILAPGNELNVEELTVPPHAPPTTVSGLGRSAEWLLVAVRDGSGWRFNPPADTVIAAGQALIVIATPEGRSELAALVESGSREARRSA